MNIKVTGTYKWSYSDNSKASNIHNVIHTVPSGIYSRCWAVSIYV